MGSERLRIYVAGPYTAVSNYERIENVFAAVDAGLELFRRGHYPYIPHLAHWIDLRAHTKGYHISWSDYIQYDMIWLRLCQALYYIGSSPGADLELGEAERIGLPIFRSIEEVPTVKEQGASHEESSSE